MSTFKLLQQFTDNDRKYIQFLSTRSFNVNRTFSITIGMYTFYQSTITESDTHIQSIESGTEYPYIITAEYKQVLDHNKTHINQHLSQHCIEQMVQQKIQDTIEQHMTEQVNDQLQYINDKITILQQRCMHLHHKVRKCLKRQ